MNPLRQTCRFLLCFLLVSNLHAQTLDGSIPGTSAVNSFAVQPDGKLLIAGDFTSVGGVPRSYVARLNQDGPLDTSFNPGMGGSVRALAVQTDGKILVGGSFTNVNGVPRNYVARLNADGTLDSGFNVSTNATVTAITVRSDGDIIIGGNFTTVGGAGHGHIARLSSNGAVDASFAAWLPNTVNALAIQTDGKILACHTGASIAGTPYRTVLRFNSDGTPDSTFLPEIYTAVQSIAIQTDGRIVIGGSFTTVGVVARNRIARLNADGTLDADFDPNASSDVYALALQADGKILMGGSFTTVGGADRKRIARLNANDTVDTSFSYNISSGSVGALAVLPNGKIQLGGNYFIRLTNDTPATSSLAVSGSSQIDWTRGGSAPEVGQVTFEGWNGSGWTPLGNATPVSGAWRMTGLALPTDGWVRARGRVPGGGSQSSSSGLIEQVQSHGAPVSPDIGLTTEDGTSLNYGSASVNFGSVLWPSASSVLKTLTITNTGRATLSGLGISLKGSNVGDYAVGSLPASSLAPGGSVSVPLTFFPQGTGAGIKNALVTISSQDPDEPSFEVALEGVFLQSDNSFNPGSNGQVLAIAVQPDGKILAGGGFNKMGAIDRKYAARLNPDGTLDASFDPTASTSVYTTAVQGDGKVIIAGNFTTVGGVARNFIARLNQDGTLDTGFNPNASALVSNLALQADGKILMAGSFTTVNGVARNYIARLNLDGTVDTGFSSSPNGTIQSLAVQTDGKILIGGYFSTVGGTARPYIARLNDNGTLDSTFAPDSSINNLAFSITLQPDGKILIAKYSTVFRLNSNGSLDTGFNQGAGDNTVLSLALQADGKILAGGQFTKMGTTTRNRIARFNADGSLDTSFDPNAGGVVNSLALQADGKVIVGGTFTSVGGGAHRYLDRLLNNIPATSSLTITGTNQIDWTRGGSAPEISQVIFEKWNGSAWVSLGNATRVSGGWHLTGLALGNAGQLRARGRTAGGYYTGSSGLIEQTTGYGPCDIAIETPLGANLASGSSYDYGTRTTGTAAPVNFTVRNAGFAQLSLGAVSIAGTKAADFTLSTAGMATTLAPGGQTTFQITFSPTSNEAKTATFSLASNDPDETPFTLTLTGTGNTAPVFANYAIATPFQTPAVIALRKLLAKASDADGDTVSVSSVAPASVNGGTVTLLADSIRYVPANGFSGVDTFSITLLDAGGASSPGTVTATVGQATSAGGSNDANPPKLDTLPGGKIGISFQGIPGRSYVVQRSVGGLDNWASLATLTADVSGKISFTDDNPPPGSAFYRLALP